MHPISMEQTARLSIGCGRWLLGAFSIYKKFRKIYIGNSGNFRLGRERSICHKSHSFTSPSPSLHQKPRCLGKLFCYFLERIFVRHVPVKQILIIGMCLTSACSHCSRFTVVETSPVNERTFQSCSCNILHRKHAPAKKASNKQEFLPTGFIHFFVDRIQDFFQTIFFIFQTQGNGEILHGPRRNSRLNYENNEFKRFSFSCLVLNLQ